MSDMLMHDSVPSQQPRSGTHFRVKRRPIASLALSAIVVLVGCGRHTPPPEAVPRPVQVAAVDPAPATPGVRYSATITPVEQVPLAFKSSGYVAALMQVKGPDGRLRDVQQGDTAGEGVTLAHVRDEDYRARMEQAKSRVAEADAAVAKARLDLERAEGLFAVKSATRPDLDAARLGQQSADARLTAARADVDLARISLDDTALRSPLRSVVLERRVERGSLVSAGVVGFILGDVRSVKAVFGVPDTVVPLLQPGKSLSLVTDALGNRTFSGRITAVSPAADSQTRVFSVEVTVPNADGALKPGMIATVQIEAPPDQKFGAGRPIVPIASVVKGDAGRDGYAVFVVESSGGRDLARRRSITVGEVVGNAIQVVDGVRVGERVVTTGSTLVKDGEPVRIIP